MTPLFPNDNEYVHIRQQQVGDCYLLAHLDCYLNEVAGGRSHIKQMFTENSDGSVTVRFPRNHYSKFLVWTDITAKYHYTQDRTTGHDVFTIPKEELQRIDRNQIGFNKYGVQSNSLAVKIIEHLSSYYFIGSLGTAPNISAMAHNFNNRYERTNAAAGFVSHLLGTQAYPAPVEYIKTMNESISPYTPSTVVDMKYGSPDASGEIHSVHTLRVHRLEVVHEKPGPIVYFHLVNPWDNSKTEVFSEEELRKREARFFVLNLDEPRETLNKTLLQCTKYTRRYIDARVNLLKALLSFQATEGGRRFLTMQCLEACVQLHSQIPYFDLLLNSSKPSAEDAQEQLIIIRQMIMAYGNKKEFFRLLCMSLPDAGFIQLLLNYEQPPQNEINEVLAEIRNDKSHPLHTAVISGIIQNREYRQAEQLILAYVQQIEDFLEKNSGSNEEEVEYHRRAQIAHVEAISLDPRLKEAEKYLGFPTGHPKVNEAYNKKIKAINAAATKRLNTLNELFVINHQEEEIDEFLIKNVKQEIEQIKNIEDIQDSEEFFAGLFQAKGDTKTNDQNHLRHELLQKAQHHLSFFLKLLACDLNEFDPSKLGHLIYQHRKQIDFKELHSILAINYLSLESLAIASVENALLFLKSRVYLEFTAIELAHIYYAHRHDRLFIDALNQARDSGFTPPPAQVPGIHRILLEAEKHEKKECMDIISKSATLKVILQAEKEAIKKHLKDKFQIKNKNNFSQLRIFNLGSQQEKLRNGFEELKSKAPTDFDAALELLKNHNLRNLELNDLCNIIYNHRNRLSPDLIQEVLRKNSLSLKDLPLSSVENSLMLLKSRLVMMFSISDLITIYSKFSEYFLFQDSLKESRKANLPSPPSNYLPSINYLLELVSKEADLEKSKSLHLKIFDNPTLVKIYHKERECLREKEVLELETSVYSSLRI
ncbi:hypothetical protein [Legionella sp. PC997]|uniref:hypothetical protein n=1 Tax=Legionella sp. PC997 TaxID=2755562 RepID=UPI0015FCD730|nr:hypothetical protein [Legionella sp. PC997]QMT61054.1 hypothetical protein HBNCFIEN_02444 [Legionella sp. PC997]